MASGKVGSLINGAEILALVREELERVEEEIRLESVAPVEAITTIGQYLHASGGKRLRPALVLLSSKLAGNGGESAIRLAAVGELVHTATLVHDDVIDSAELRRGRPSPNARWGNHTSVLAGDWLYMKAFQIALREENFHILDLLIVVTQMMVEGELIQLERLGSIAVSEAEYMDLVYRKTACLFAACARLGAAVGGADQSTERELGEYARNLGMAFQLVDDVLDFTADEEVLGKPVGGDLREGKVTLPLIYALEGAGPHERRLVETVLADRSYERVPFAGILSFIRKRGGIERTRERAQRFTDEARAIMAAFPDSPYQRALYGLAELVTEREY
ncbi:MAG: polyprenyl synthetase family protein [Acidobacteriota bacterium]